MAKVREIPAASDGDNNGSERNETVSNPTHAVTVSFWVDTIIPVVKLIDL